MKTSLYLLIMTVLFSCGTSSDVQTEFNQHEILPDILKVAPNQIVQVNNVDIEMLKYIRNDRSFFYL